MFLIKPYFLSLFLVIVPNLLTTSSISAQSFDCRMAKAADEIAICANSTLSSLDMQMAKLYLAKHRSAEGLDRTQLESDQRGFRKLRRTCVGSFVCLKSAYDVRLSTLSGSDSKPTAVPPTDGQVSDFTTKSDNSDDSQPPCFKTPDNNFVSCTGTYRGVSATYSGGLKNGSFEGQGVLKVSNGNEYTGGFKDGMPDGQITASFATGASFTGNFKQGKEEGQGTFKWSDGRSYVGDFVQSKRTGQGVFVNKAGFKYVGKFDDGLPVDVNVYNPDGSLRSSHVFSRKDDKGEYIMSPVPGASVGDLIDVKADKPGTRSALPSCPPTQSENSPPCFGRSVAGNGDVYIGEFEGGQRNGEGTYRWPSGYFYEGSWKHGKKSGRGIFQYANGDKYEGLFQNGLFDGSGTLTFKTGEKYVGEFKNDHFDGTGIFYNADGSVRNTGQYKNGDLVSRAKDKTDGATGYQAGLILLGGIAFISAILAFFALLNKTRTTVIKNEGATAVSDGRDQRAEMTAVVNSADRLSPVAGAISGEEKVIETQDLGDKGDKAELESGYQAVKQKSLFRKYKDFRQRNSLGAMLDKYASTSSKAAKNVSYIRIGLISLAVLSVVYRVGNFYRGPDLSCSSDDGKGVVIKIAKDFYKDMFDIEKSEFRMVAIRTTFNNKYETNCEANLEFKYVFSPLVSVDFLRLATSLSYGDPGVWQSRPIKYTLQPTDDGNIYGKVVGLKAQ